MSDITLLKYVAFRQPTKGPKNRLCETIASTDTDNLYLQDDLVCWEKGDKVVYIPISNIREMEVA